MDFVETNTLFIQAIKEFQRVEEQYLSKFGKSSLDRVLLYDPLHIEQYPEEVLAATDKLEKAIEKNQPLDQIPEEMWKNLIF